MQKIPALIILSLLVMLILFRLLTMVYSLILKLIRKHFQSGKQPFEKPIR